VIFRLEARRTNRINNWGYDATGNMLSVANMSRSLTYDAENRIATATVGSQTADYRFDGDGHRVTKVLCPTVTTCTASTTGAAVTIYVYDPIGNLAQEYGPPGATGTEYLVPDVLGSVGFIGFALGSTGLVTDSRMLYNPAGQWM